VPYKKGTGTKETGIGKGIRKRDRVLKETLHRGEPNCRDGKSPAHRYSEVKKD